MGTITAGLGASSLDLNLVTRLYDQLNELPLPSFLVQRMKLPCLAFQIKSISPFLSGSEVVFRAHAGALGAVVIKTGRNLMRLDSLYLVHPWIDFLLDRCAAENTVETMSEDDFSHLDEFQSLPHLSTASRADSLNLNPLSPSFVELGMDKQTRVYQLLARLRQPFGALLLTPTRRNVDEYRRIATESLITVQVKEITSAMLDGLIQSVRVLDVL